MDIKKIKANSTMTSVLMSLILVMAIFTGMYLWWENNATSSGYNLEGVYQDTYSNINKSQSDLDNNIEAIKTSFNNIKEADNTFQVALNGMKVLGSTLKLPISFVDTTLQTYSYMEKPLDYIPTWVKVFSIMSLTILILFIVLSILKGDGKL